MFHYFLLDQDQRGEWEKDSERLEWMEENRYEGKTWKEWRQDHCKIAHKIAKWLCIGQQCWDQREKTEWMKDVEELCMMLNC